MTHLIIHELTTRAPFALLKPERHIRIGDTVIFEWEPKILFPEDLEESPSPPPAPTQFSVVVTDVIDGKGLMKGYQLISWFVDAERPGGLAQ